MEFVYDESQSLTVKDYFDKYKDELPRLVIVTGGHYGLTKYDDFSTDQVIRFHTYSTQQRVIARVSTEATTCRLEFLNIPVDKRYRFRVVRGWRNVGPVETLDQILPRYKTPDGKLKPFLIQFADIYPGVDSTVFANNRSVQLDFLIMKHFEENYLLGNCLVDGVISTKVSIAALSNKIYLTNITGIKGQDEKGFAEYLDGLNAIICKHTKFNRNAGNPDITKISHDSVDTGTGASISPDNPLVPLEHIFPGMEEEPPPLPPSRDGYMRLSADNTHTTLYCRLDSNNIQRSNSEYSRISGGRLLPDIPTSSDSDEEDGVLFTFKRQLSAPTQTYSSKRNDVSTLSVKDIGKALKTLKLDKYVTEFEVQRIDGALLQELDTTILVDTFHLEPYEAERLVEYAKYGFVPNV